MLNPGGYTTGSLNQSAVTRINNDQIRGAQASMPLNRAAQLSLRKKSKPTSTPAAPVGNPPSSVPVPLSQTKPTVLPTGGPRAPETMAEGFDPEVFKENMINEITGAVRTRNFLSSPEFKDAQTLVQLKNQFNTNNPRRHLEAKLPIQQIVERMVSR